MNALMAVMSVIAASAAIWGSVLGCKATCCDRTVTGVRIISMSLLRHLLNIVIYQQFHSSSNCSSLVNAVYFYLDDLDLVFAFTSRTH